MIERSFEETQAIRKDVAERYREKFPNIVLEPLWYGRRPNEKTRVEGKHAILDQNTGTVFNVCSDLYKPVFHEEVVHLVEEAARKLPEFGKPTIKIQQLADGGKLRVEAKFEEVAYDINPKVGDFVNPTINVFSSYDLGWKYGGRFGAYRLICSNGASVGKIFDSFKKRHLTSLDPNELSVTIQNGMLKFSEQTELWQRWANEKLLPEQYAGLWAELPFSPTEKEKIEQLPEAGTKLLLPQALASGDLTRWDFYNVVTQFASHEISSAIRTVEIQPTITSIFERI